MSEEAILEGDVKTVAQKKTCTMEGCGRGLHSRGMCTLHYHRLMKNGDPNIVRKAGIPVREKERKCSIEKCESRHHAKEYCKHHYLRFMRSGDPLYEKPIKLESERVQKPCSVNGCDGKYRALGLCNHHYYRKNKEDAENGISSADIASKPGPKPKDYERPECSHPDCETTSYSRSMCRKHYRLSLSTPTSSSKKTATAKPKPVEISTTIRVSLAGVKKSYREIADYIDSELKPKLCLLDPINDSLFLVFKGTPNTDDIDEAVGRAKMDGLALAS